MLHHVSLGTSDVARARRFYDAVMATLNLPVLLAQDDGAHYGTGEIVFSIMQPADGAPAAPGNGVHVAFQARDRAMVDRFHAAGLAHGGRDDGAPGLRPDYDANYYAAFLRDPDGNKIEAVTMSAA